MSILNAHRKPRDAVHGVLLLDKPLGLSSNDALMRARRLLNAEKAGHGGTLDPLASGLLPLAFGEATKFADDLLSADKTYIAGVRFGITTSTGDREGEILSQQALPQDSAFPEKLDAVLKQFRGPISQVPPMYSALKKDGKALYEYARRGETVERLARPVHIHSLEVVSSDLEAFPDAFDVLDGFPVVHLEVSCSKGTYIRVLAEEIGAALGYGAHLASLRRTGVDVLKIDHAISLDALEALSLEARQATLSPVDHLLKKLPIVQLDAEQARRLLLGQRLSPLAFAEQLSSPSLVSALVARAYAPDGQLLGTVDIDEHALRPRRLMRNSHALQLSEPLEAQA